MPLLLAESIDRSVASEATSSSRQRMPQQRHMAAAARATAATLVDNLFVEKLWNLLSHGISQHVATFMRDCMIVGVDAL
jgi:hypothetical protein